VELRRRISGEVNHLVAAVQEEAAVDPTASGAPVHLADRAETGVDADVAVLRVTDELLSEIDAALARIDQQTYGRCTECGGPIAAARLDALPQVARCAACAESEIKNRG
jgi:DnaK suppressor protein